jgi:DNA invertase Pin-like site-specific DNA recombinase
VSKRAVIYLRVSSTEQSVENQQPELERVCEEKGWDIVEILTEEASA